MASSNHLSLSRYQQGDWFGVVRNGTVVLLGPDTPHALIDTVWELLASAPEAHEVLHEVTDAFGVSLSRIPPFGIIDSKDALRVFLRGGISNSLCRWPEVRNTSQGVTSPPGLNGDLQTPTLTASG